MPYFNNKSNQVSESKRRISCNRRRTECTNEERRRRRRNVAMTLMDSLVIGMSGESDASWGSPKETPGSIAQ